MSSTIKRPNGHKWIQFTDGNQKRKTLRLGKCSVKDAQKIATKVDELNFAKTNNTVMGLEAASWLRGIGDQLHGKLAAVGLIEARESTELQTFLRGYIESRTDLKASTIGKYENVENRLLEYFKSNRSIGTITAGDAEEFARWLRNLPSVKSDNTVRKAIQLCKTIFGHAVKKQLIGSNPFTGMASNTLPKTDRFYFVTPEEAEKVVEECSSNFWILLFVLARYGGMRTPSEPRALKWTDIDWEKNTILINASKTEHHGDGQRLMPLFPEILPHLQEAFENAKAGAIYVLPKLQDKKYNPATHMARVVTKACGKVWPKVFQNCRSTRQTELSQRFPAHVVAGWLGNSTRIAEQFYLQTTEEHFQQALKGEAEPEAVLGNKVRLKQNPKQQAAATNGTEMQKPRVNRGSANRCVPVPIGALDKVPARGLEPPLP
jgi:integrase